MTTVAVLGGTGMLGSMLVDVFASDPELKVFASARNDSSDRRSDVEWRVLDAATSSVPSIEETIAGADWVVNAIGLIKQRIDDADRSTVRDAIKVNALFPYDLDDAASHQGAKVIQIATDCVYSGTRGNYTESDPHDPVDVYGKTKSVGEVPSDFFSHVRCSIIGPEERSAVSLLGWFLAQPRGASVSGFANHRWNGVTTLHFARVCAGLIKNGIGPPSLTHLVPHDQVTKAELLNVVAQSFGRSDIEIDVVDAPSSVDRTLDTEHAEVNRELWRQAGYDEPPSIAAMIAELADYSRPR